MKVDRFVYCILYMPIFYNKKININVYFAFCSEQSPDHSPPQKKLKLNAKKSVSQVTLVTVCFGVLLYTRDAQ